jgi:hypothetical protein
MKKKYRKALKKLIAQQSSMKSLADSRDIGFGTQAIVDAINSLRTNLAASMPRNIRSA